MSEIEFRLPSKVPYGYVNVRFDIPGDAPEPKMIAALYASYVMAFTEQERESLNAYGKPSEAPPGDVQAAKARLVKGQKPRTVDEADVMAEEAVKLIVNELDGKVVSEETHDKPWENEAPKVKKPWENGGSAPEPAQIDW